MNRRDWWSTFRWDEKLSFDDALDLIRSILENGRIVYSPHLRERMAERSFTIQDVEHILENGVVIAQEFDKRNRNWKYRISGKTIDDDQAIVVSAVLDRKSLIVITVF